MQDADGDPLPVPSPRRRSAPTFLAMARPRTYDRETALDHALGVFERLGYEAASLQDLVDGTGLSRSSLYAEFGSKHGLYLAALDRYRSDGTSRLEETFAAAPTALAGIEAYLDSVVRGAGDGDEPPAAGCLVTNVAVEVAARDAETARRVRQSLDGLLAAFERQIERAQAEGEVAPEADARALAESVVTTVYGLRTMSKAGASRALAARVARRQVERLRR